MKTRLLVGSIPPKKGFYALRIVEGPLTLQRLWFLHTCVHVTLTVSDAQGPRPRWTARRMYGAHGKVLALLEGTRHFGVSFWYRQGSRRESIHLFPGHLRRFHLRRRR